MAKYDVEVRICSVDSDGDVCGTLTIRNLTPSLPKVVTFFDGEIVGDKHSFITDKWGATSEDDEAHWARFKRDIYLRGTDSAYRGDETPEERDSAMQERKLLENVVFMRLKERCFLKNSSCTEQDLSGASFAGFYYIAVELNPAPAYPKRSRIRSSTAYGSSTNLSRSLLSQSAPTYSLHDQRQPFSSTAFRPAPSLLTRSDSYASIVRGSSLSRPPSQPSSGASTPIAIRHSSSTVSLKQDDAKPFDEENVEEISLYSPPLDEYPPPFSPSSLPTAAAQRSGFPFDRSASATPSRGRAFTPAYKTSADISSTNLATRFYNPTTGYRGPWANAVMRGFYFASADPDSSGEGDSDPYQELELHYVGDGGGALLEETAQESTEYDELGLITKVQGSRMDEERKKMAKDFERRKRYLMPKSSSSFSFL